MKIKKILFENPGFRMLKNIEIEISDRITVIAGHNGIGKSTILGLIANGSEIKKRDGATLYKSSFQAQFHELFVLDKEKDYSIDRASKPSFKLVYSKDGAEDLVKLCNVSKHTEKRMQGEKEITYDRLKIVPRGLQDGWDVGQSAKVTIPTLFLSMSRMLPLGDKQENLSTLCLKNMASEDIVYIRDNFKKIIDHNIKSDSDAITKHEVNGTTKRSFLPDFDHSTKTISLGQDALSSIISAFASFNKLKRNQGDNYTGGILLIDEIDAGFHPIAQVRLVELIKTEAKRLKLQVIVTSHSLTIVQEVTKISDSTARNGNNYDSVVYIMNTLSPRLMHDVSYQKVKADMFNILVKEEDKPEVKIYFEDHEAKWFFDEIIKYKNINLTAKYNQKFILIAAKLGSKNLVQLHKEDGYFKSVVIVFDNDVMSESKTREYINSNDNIVVLPASVSSENVNPSERTPEYQIYQYIKQLIKDDNHPIWSSSPDNYHSQIVRDSIIKPYDESVAISSDHKKLRDHNKTWFNDQKTHFEKMELIKHFIDDNEVLVNAFINDIETAISSVITLNETK